MTEPNRGGRSGETHEQFPLAFLGMFESLRMGPTFARGRRDERAGHVRSLTVSGSLVVALVRGPDDPVAFRSRIAARAFGASDWARVEKALVAEARYVAGLLDGRMPAGIEAVFAEAGLALLPLSLDEVAMDCSCERWPVPCVHLAATCYALARAFESDPFEVFTWRGRSRDELLMRLRRLRDATASAAAAAGAAGDSAAAGGTAAGGDAAWGSGSAGSGGSADRSGSADRGGAAGRGGSAGQGGPVGSGAGEAGLLGSLVDPADPGAFWGVEVPAPAESPAGVRPDALLDQLDAPALSHHGKPVTEVLRVAYLALPDETAE